MYIAVDIGGTKTLVAAYSEEGELLKSEKQPTDANFDSFIKQLVGLIDSVSASQRIDAIGIAVPALIDEEAGVAREFGNLKWTDVDVVTPLKEAFTNNVYLENDAKAGTLGEANMGAGKGHDVVLYVTLSTGIGAGVTEGGRLVKSLRHMEGGHMTFYHDGEYVVWESFASGKAFYEEFGMKGEDDENPEHWKAWAEDVSIGLYDLIATIQPNVVVLGGSMGNHFAKYHTFLQAAIQAKRSHMVDMPSIVQAADSDKAVINGCYILCKQHSED